MCVCAELNDFVSGSSEHEDQMKKLQKSLDTERVLKVEAINKLTQVHNQWNTHSLSALSSSPRVNDFLIPFLLLYL